MIILILSFLLLLAIILAGYFYECRQVTKHKREIEELDREREKIDRATMELFFEAHQQLLRKD